MPANMASGWRALNVDSDVESEEEVDNTKEIQIEEALKLYQTALKYHSEGPLSFEKTAEAYRALFASEIFQYNESLSEYKRHELYGDTLVFDTILDDESDAGPSQVVGVGETAPNTLPQILHLSHKNYGQFMLEMMQHWIREQAGIAVPRQEVSTHILAALAQFADALDKEDTDLDLWLRTASVAALLGSRRITRFCLEAVLDGDDELLDSILRLPGLEEGFAGQQLRELLAKLEDNVSLMQAPMSTMHRKKLSETMKKRLNPYPFAPLPSEVAETLPSNAATRPADRIQLTPAKWDWAGVGEAILQHFMAEQGGFIPLPPPGSSVNLNMPPDAAVAASEHTEATPPDISISTNEIASGQDSAEHVAVSATTNPEVTSANGEEITTGEAKKDAADKHAEDEPVVASALSRKRSTDSAGLPETADGGRSRSKRIRARDTVTDSSIGAESTGPDLAKQLEDKLYAFTHADKCLFEIVNDIFERLGTDGLGSPKELRDFVMDPQADASDHANANVDKAARDLYLALQSSSTNVASILLNGEAVDLGGISREAGLNAFLGHAKASTLHSCSKPVLRSERLGEFAANAGKNWLSVKEIAFAWLEMLLAPYSLPSLTESTRTTKSSYMQYRWAEDLKRHLVQIIVNFDEFIYQQLLDRIDELQRRILLRRSQGMEHELSGWDCSQIEMVEILFELHLDIYSLIKHPHSGVDSATQMIQQDRLGRWSALARDVMQIRSDCEPYTGMDELVIRHIWASVFQMTVSDDMQREYVISAMEELKDIFHSVGDPVIEIQNNAVMPELSVGAIDRELARISMKDFFLKVFDQDEKDPVAIIESLEPILEPNEEIIQIPLSDASADNGDTTGSRSLPTIAHPSDHATQASRPSPFQEMRRFLDNANVSLRLSLWQRLREAYEAIEYPSKVISCYLRSIETLVGELKLSAYTDSPTPDRQAKLLGKLRIIDEVLVKVLAIVKDEKDNKPYDCLTDEHVQSSMGALSHLLRVLSASNVLEDMLRVGHIPVPRYTGCPAGTYATIMARLHDMQLRAWLLQYHLLKEGISQNPATFPTPSEDQFEFLRHVHYATGVRGFCHMAGRLFLRLAKDEILRMDDIIDGNNRDTELAQVLYDLYGLKTFIQPVDCHEFGSIAEVLDKRTASQLLSFIVSQARKVNIRDLPKMDLRVTIEKVHGALGRPKSNEDVSLNRKIITLYFRSPVDPRSLYNCLKGIGSLSTKQISAEAASIASKRWYFLMGNINLNKFRAQKRLTQGPTEDLNFAQAFFLQDLECSVDQWETWYRLAQANDTQLEECVLWNADKINSNSAELMTFQRAAIHCYVMAVACAVRDADAAPQTRLKISEMYTDFGNRVYSSSREPFSMSAFGLRETEHKYYSGHADQLVYQSVPFKPLSTYTAWKFASILYRRAINGKPDMWWNYYMLGKCLWKMYCANADAALSAAEQDEPPHPTSGPTWEEVVDALVSAIETLPGKKERGREPIMEPHYKVVAVAHKLFQRKIIDHEQGDQIVRHTSYSQNISAPDSPDDWERYVLAVLKALRSADKSSWHHRITARSAHVIYDESNDPMVKYGAKHELSQQIFTKTMTVQVWKPEYERPGRHFVYTSRYTRFFIQLLDQTGDKANMEALARRVRRKQTDFFQHSQLWQELCVQYLKLLRRTGRIPDGHEDTIFKSINHDEFAVLATRVEAWCHDPNTQHPVLDVLRDVIELKRLNNGLMKALPIDDLIGDTYAVLYSEVGPTLQPLPSEVNLPLSITPPTHPNFNPLPASSLAPVQVDGTAEGSQNLNTPFNLYHPSQLQGAAQQGPPQAQPETTTKSRAKAVGRREIQRRAETASIKPTAPASATTLTSTSIPIRSPPTTTSSIMPLRTSPEKQTQNDKEPTNHNAHFQSRFSGTATTIASFAHVESAPGSVHDDADDESELSELDESEVREMRAEADIQDDPADTIDVKPLFPNLRRFSGKHGEEAGKKNKGGSDQVVQAQEK